MVVVVVGVLGGMLGGVAEGGLGPQFGAQTFAPFSCCLIRVLRCGTPLETS